MLQQPVQKAAQVVALHSEPLHLTARWPDSIEGGHAPHDVSEQHVQQAQQQVLLSGSALITLVGQNGQQLVVDVVQLRRGVGDLRQMQGLRQSEDALAECEHGRRLVFVVQQLLGRPPAVRLCLRRRHTFPLLPHSLSQLHHQLVQRVLCLLLVARAVLRYSPPRQSTLGQHTLIHARSQYLLQQNQQRSEGRVLAVSVVVFNSYVRYQP